MVRRYKRTVAAFHVITDAVIGVSAFLSAYLIRFDSALFTVTKGTPPFWQYAQLPPCL